MAKVSLNEVVDYLNDFMDEVEDGPIIPEILPELREIVETGFEENFDNAVDNEGTPWPPHAPSTVARYGEHPLLVLSGTLKESMTDSSSEYAVESYTDRTYSRGSSLEYANVHNFGYGYIPKRQYRYFSPRTVREILVLVAREMTGKAASTLRRTILVRG